MAGAELCWNKKIRWPHLWLLRSRSPPQLHMLRKASQRSKREAALFHNRYCQAPIGLCTGIHLGKKMCTDIGEGPGTEQMWEKKWDNWPDEDKDPEELSKYKWFNHLFTALLLIGEDVHTVSLQVCIPVCFGPNKLFLCQVLHVLCYANNNNTAVQPWTGECWIPPKKDTPHPRAKENPNKMVGRVKSYLDSKPMIARDARKAQTKPVCART